MKSIKKIVTIGLLTLLSSCQLSFNQSSSSSSQESSSSSTSSESSISSSVSSESSESSSTSSSSESSDSISSVSSSSSTSISSSSVSSSVSSSATSSSSYSSSSSSSASVSSSSSSSSSSSFSSSSSSSSSLSSSSSSSSSSTSMSSSSSSSSSSINNAIITSLKTYPESIGVTFESTDNSPVVEYKLHSASAYQKLNDELVREVSSNVIQADILGLKAGQYDIRITNSQNQVELVEDITVQRIDRSGFAHFKSKDLVGAYNDDGTLKSNAKVIYVTDENKNDVVLDKYVGLGNILANISKITYPLCIRFLDVVQTTHWNSIEYGSSVTLYDKDNNKVTDSKLTESDIISRGINSMSDDEAKGIVKLEGLVNEIKYSSSEYDSNFGMMNVSESTKGLTIEGVGENAGLYQWGFNFKKSKYVEVRNLTFTNNPEDACSFEGEEDVSKHGYSFVHHNTFNRGANRWDVTAEQDKHDGDGATDIKRVSNITFAYNHYIKCKKTGLVGSGDSIKQYNVTFHHNFYDQCGSRLPLARQANMHMYNNYYYGTTGTNISLRADAYAFFESNYFERCNKPIEVVTTSSYKPAGKDFNNVFVSCTSSQQSTKVTSRTQTVESNNLYKNFDIDATIFYYDATNQKSDVEYLTTAEQAKLDALSISGAGKAIQNY